jgi:hypothetical protein
MDPTKEQRGYHVASVTDLYSRILGVLDWGVIYYPQKM